MIYTVIAPAAESLDFSALPDAVREHILSAKNERLRRERATAYVILYKAAERFFTEAPSIIFTEGGKPRFADGNIHFSISHTDGAVAVTLSDKAAVGVDIECERERIYAEKIEERFLGEVKLPPALLSVKYLFAEATESGEFVFSDLMENNISAEQIAESDNLPFTAKWTLAEAAVKLTGDGMTAAKKAGEILLKSNADIIKIKIKSKTFYLTTAEEK